MRNEDMYDNVGFLVGLTARSMKQTFNKKLKEHHIEITIDQLRVLKVLYHKNGINQQEIADWLVVEKPGITRHLDQLAEKGYIERRADADDRRNNLIYMTKKAEDLIHRVMEVADKTRQKLTSNISEEEMDTLRTVCKKIIQNIKEHKKAL